MVDLIAKAVVDASVKIPRELGPGLLESVCGIERVVNSLPEENLCVLASWRETPIEAELPPPHR